jgi:hydrogenase-4 component B
MGGIALVTALVAFSLYRLLSARRSSMRWGPTWECGFGDLGAHAQASAKGFAENAAFAFAPLLRYRTIVKIKGRDRRHFPDDVEVESQTESIIEQRIYLPIVRLIHAIGGRIVLLQTGSIHLYLAYFLLTLVVLMLIGIFA